MKTHLPLYLFMICYWPLHAAADASYKWSDEQGHVHYSQLKPALDTHVYTISASPAQSGNNTQSLQKASIGVAYKWHDEQSQVHYSQAIPLIYKTLEKVIIYNDNGVLASLGEKLEEQSLFGAPLAHDVGDTGNQSPSHEPTASVGNARLDGDTAKGESKQTSTTDWYKAGSDDGGMALMSLTGSVATNTKNRTASDDNAGVAVAFFPPCLTLQDFIDGGSVRIYQCNDADCSHPQCANTANLTGMRERVRKALLGTGICNDCSGGIVRRMANRLDSSSISQAEQRLIQSSSPEARNLLFKLSARPEAMHLVSERLVELFTVDLTRQILDEMFEKWQSALTAAGQLPSQPMLDAHNGLRQQISERQQALAGESIASTAMLIDIYSKLKTSLQDKRNQAQKL